MKKIFLLIFVFLVPSSCVFLNNQFEEKYWKLFSIEGDKVLIYDKTALSKKNAHLIFKSNGRVTGNTGCNIVNARFEREKNVTHFIGVVTSKNQCSKESSKIEERFINFLQKSEYMIVNESSLTIYNKNKDITLIFHKE